ncbi:MAG: deoxyribodipyrimidine photo-lyase [Alphaproteobacteria bacterium]|nr:deoxyribodipyrimidine photo-lyase [Alphaproteobacteria bacterium]
MTSVIWFRQDLRLADNPALVHAAARGPILGLYVLDETSAPNGRPIGGASRWWLHKSLEALSKAFGGLVLLRGNPRELVPAFAEAAKATGVYWNRCYEPYSVARDTAVKAALKAMDVDASSFNGSLLFEPWDIKTLDGAPYKVYSPFWRACQKSTVAVPQAVSNFEAASRRPMGDRLTDWRLLPSKPNWAREFETTWTPGEAGALVRFNAFLNHNLRGYAELRDRPGKPNVSRLSPHLHFGEISPRQVWATAKMHAEIQPASRADCDKFLAELGWREFSHHLLYHFPQLPVLNWKPEFDAYPWSDNAAYLASWQKGMTGYPIVDAGMRELWKTGSMHNRVRMIAASFLIKHLRIDWRQGEAWFWDTLVDADLANNTASWQWVAGCGADAAPYFRIFNPIAQGRKFDPDGTYVRRWCPELAKLPNDLIHAPFEGTISQLEAAGVRLGTTYPKPLVDHASARDAALAGYARIKSANV